MWLTGTTVPDHNTINRFRSRRLKEVLKTVFATIVKFLVSEGFVSPDVAYTDLSPVRTPPPRRWRGCWCRSMKP